MRLLRQPKNAATILVYHSISRAKHFSAVTPENFEEHMQALKENAFNVVSLDQLALYRKNGDIPPKTVCITFDDGYRDNFTTAFPVLKKYSFPSTIFVVTDVIGKVWNVRGEEFEMLSEMDIREFASSELITIAPHTASHAKLDMLVAADVQREIQESEARIKSITNIQSRHFAYPFGRFNNMVRATIRDSGIEFAYAMSPGFVRPQTNNDTLPRNAIDRTTTATQCIGIAQWGRISRSRFV